MEHERSLNDLLVKDIDPAARKWIERVMGRPLSDDERVYVLAYHRGDMVHKSGRHPARERLLQLMDQAAARVDRSGIADDELNDAIEGAIDRVRGRRSAAGF